MNLLKNLMIAMVQSSGQPLPANILTQIQAQSQKNGTGIFGQFLNLNPLNQTNNATVMPTPPTPPGDLQDTAAVKTYNDALLAYNQQFQTYQTNIFQIFNQRFMMMQQAILQAQRAQQQSASSTASSGTSGVGGILSGDSSPDI